jgi:hypothetical protein
VARAFRRHHRNVEISARFDQAEMDVEAVREKKRRAVFHIGREIGLVDVRLQFVRRDHHHHVGPFGRVRIRHHLETGRFRLSGRSAFTRRDRHVLDAGIAHVERMSMALRAEADDGDFLVLDEIQIGIAIVIDTHVRFLELGFPLPRRGRGSG